MDRMPDAPLVREVRATAGGVPGVLAVEKLLIRKSGIVFHCEIHVQADPALSLDAAHALGGRVKSALRAANPQLQGVLIHMEPYHPSEGEP
jgi:divalent metal cation (Fe/Co/Zn/Cd) transporter